MLIGIDSAMVSFQFFSSCYTLTSFSQLVELGIPVSPLPSNTTRINIMIITFLVREFYATSFKPLFKGRGTTQCISGFINILACILCPSLYPTYQNRATTTLWLGRPDPSYTKRSWGCPQKTEKWCGKWFQPNYPHVLAEPAIWGEPWTEPWDDVTSYISRRIQTHPENRIFRVPIPSEKNRNGGVIPDS